MRPYVLVSDLVLANLGGMHSIKGRAVAKGGNRSIRTPNTRICCAVDVMPYQGKIVVSNGRRSLKVEGLDSDKLAGYGYIKGIGYLVPPSLISESLQ
jgi:hypothetical protein